MKTSGQKRNETGRAPIVMAFLLAVLATGGGIFLMQSRVDDRTSPDSSQAGPSAPEGTETTPVGITPPVPPPAAQTPGVEGDVDGTTPPPFADSRRIFGIVTDDEDHGVAAAKICWIPGTILTDIRGYSHDQSLFGDRSKLAGTVQGELRTALAKSTLAACNDSGHYELHVDGQAGHGVLIVAKKSFTTQTRHLSFASMSTDSKEVQVDFLLSRGASLSGRVVENETQAPALGMVVLARLAKPGVPQVFSRFDDNTPGAMVRDDGSYSIAGLEPGDYYVAPQTGTSDFVAVDGEGTQKVFVGVEDPTTGVDFNVVRGGTVRGQVTSPEGDPVNEARIVVLPDNFMELAMTGNVRGLSAMTEDQNRTDDQGRYEIRGVPLDKTMRIAARNQGFATTDGGTFELTREQRRMEIDIELFYGSKISGVVRDEEGNFVPEVHVSAKPDLSELMQGISAFAMGSNGTESDDRGNFVIQNLPAGKYTLSAGRVRKYNPFTSGKDSIVVEVDGIESVTGIELRQETNAASQTETSITGIARDDLGNPLEGVDIETTGMQMGIPRTHHASSDADGHFTLPVEEGARVTLRGRLKGYDETRHRNIAAGASDVVLVLDRWGSVSGRVQTADGSPPAASFQVSAKRSGSESPIDKMQGTIERMTSGGTWKEGEKDGTFLLENVPSGGVEITAKAAGFAPATSGVVTVHPGEELRGVLIVVTAGSTLRGQVLLEGSAVAGASVHVSPASDDSADFLARMVPGMFKTDGGIVTDSDGYFEVPHLAAGQYSVSAEHSSYAPSDIVRVNVSAGKAVSMPALELSRGGRVEGKITDASGTPKKGMMIQVMGDSGMKMAYSDTHGAFKVDSLKPGGYMLSIMNMSEMQSGNMELKTRSFSIEGDAVVTLDVVYGLGFRIYGRFEGLPETSGMRVIQLRRPGGPLPEEINPLDIQVAMEANKYTAGVAFLKPDGTYEIKDIEAGKYFLEIPVIPSDPTDLKAYNDMDRTPHYRTEITVRNTDVEHNIKVGKAP